MVGFESKECNDCGEELEITVVDGNYSPLGLVIACSCTEAPVQGVSLERNRVPDGWQ